MAKASKTATKEKEAPAKSTGDEYKFGVEDLADALDIEPASARIKLRNANIKKAANGRYGWKTKADLQEVVDKLKSKAPAKKKEAEEEPKKKAGKKPTKK